METSKKSTYIIAAVSLMIIVAAIYFLFIFQKSPNKIKSEEGLKFVESIEGIDIDKRPFVTLTPTADGAEIIISIENMNEFDKIEYELTYQADNPQISGEKIQRGAVETDVNTSQAKYKKSLLLGTASRGVRSPDTGVTDGELALHLFKGDAEYLSETRWDRFEIGTSGGEILDYTGNFSLDVPRLTKNYWVIIADTVGVPPNADFSASDVKLPVFGTYSVAPEFTTSASLSIKLTGDVKSPKLYTYSNQDSSWQSVESTYEGGALAAEVDSFGTFVIVSPK